MHCGNKNLVSVLKDYKYNSFDMFDEALSIALNNDLSTIHDMDFSDNKKTILEFISKFSNQNDDVPVYYAVYFVGGKGDLYKKIDYVLESFYDIVNDYRSDCVTVHLIINASDNPDSDFRKWVNANQTILLTNTINEVRKFKEVHFKFTVKAEVNDSVLRSEIVMDSEMEMEGVQFLFYLYRDGIVIEKGQWGDCNCKEWKLTQDGIYCTQGYVRRKEFRVYKRSFPVSYFTEKTVGCYRDFMNSSADCEGDTTLLYDTLPFVKSEYPFADFIICSENSDGSSKELNECVNDFVERFSAFSQREFHLGDSNIYICIDGGLVINNDERMQIFSGISIIDDKVVIGANDIPETVDLRALSEGYGSYTAVDVNVNDRSVHIFRDGFGMGKWFVYRDDNVFCLGNNYHSFLLFLKSIKRELSIDFEKCAVLLSSESVQFLSQNICRQMDVKQVEQISTDYIYTFEEGWKTKKTWYGNLITSKISYHEEEYQKYVKEAIAEMWHNIKIIYEDSRFDYIISDLSGGIDTRLIYALLTNLDPDYKSRTRISSYDVPGTEDLEIATEINSVFGMEYDNLPRRVMIKSLREADAYMRSRELGIYFSFFPLNNWPFPYKHIHEKYSYICFNGSFGEVEARPYVTRHYINKYDDQDMSPEDFAAIVLEDISYKIDAPCNEVFLSLIKQEIKSIDSLSLYETYESMYRQYRHGSHFNYQIYFECNERRWPVLQSKTAMILHHIMINSFRSSKLEFDLIAEANPILLGFRYEYKKDTDDYVELRDYILAENRYKSIRNISGNSDYVEAWQQAERQKAESWEWLKDGDSIAFSNELYDSEIKKRGLYLLRKLLHYSPELEKMIGIELFYYLKKENANWQVFYNKLASITDQLTLISSL